MKSKLSALAILFGVLVFRPWHTVNKLVGIQVIADSVRAASNVRDSLFVTQGMASVSSPVTVVLPPQQVDSLAIQVQQKEAEKMALADKLADQNKEIKKLKTAAVKNSDEIITLKEINAMVARQNKPKPEIDETSDLEKAYNGPDKPKKE